jgi:hypothetical protein
MPLMLVLLVGLAGPLRASALTIGAGDQTSAMFSDPRFRVLGVHYARLDVPWDLLGQPELAEHVETWLAAAHADGVHPLITFDHDQRPGRHRKLPSSQSFARQFARFHRAFPWVKEFATWNEANYCGEATCHRAALVAAYYRRIRKACPACVVLGSELLDDSNMGSWTREFRSAMGGREPMVWGLHNYIGANRLQSGSTRSLLRATRASIWFTETGGIVSRHNHSSIAFPESQAHAARVTEYVFSRLARLSPRIKRVYIYQWNGTGPKSNWDSGLIAPNGKVRPAYDVFVRQLAEFGQLPATFAAQSALSAADGFG